MSDRSMGGMVDNATVAAAANAYVHNDFKGVTSNQNLMNHTIEPSSQQQHSTATLIGTSNGRRAVSNPKTFMRARMAQQTNNHHGPTSRSKSRHANQTHTIDLGSNSSVTRQ